MALVSKSVSPVRDSMKVKGDPSPVNGEGDKPNRYVAQSVALVSTMMCEGAQPDRGKKIRTNNSK